MSLSPPQYEAGWGGSESDSSALGGGRGGEGNGGADGGVQSKSSETLKPLN